MSETGGTPEAPRRRRPRYAGTHPRTFQEKYKEHRPEQYPGDIAKVLAAGKTPAGTHRPIMVAEILECLAPAPGETAVDGTLGYGGHARELLARIQPGGRLLGLDADPLELPKTEARLRALGHGPDCFTAAQGNFAGLPKALGALGLAGADMILADLGVSSMQLDDPARGFSTKLNGPLDMRMNPKRGVPASTWLEKTSTETLAILLRENADEPHAEELARALAGRKIETTSALAAIVRGEVRAKAPEEIARTIRRVFQAVRIAVNEEFATLEALLRVLPQVLLKGGRVAILTFHSGEDRRVKKSFQAHRESGLFVEVSDVIRPIPAECHANPRASAAKLRWARRA